LRRGKQAREERKKRADERQEARASRTTLEQIELLDRRFGKNVGAVKERARLAKSSASTHRSDSEKIPTTKSQRRKEKAKRHEARRADGN
jgi:predicted transcriptional regulator